MVLATLQGAQVIKHMFKDYVALEMYVSNTVAGITLENIEVRLSGLSKGWEDLGASAISKLENGQQASAVVVLRKAPAAADSAGFLCGNFGAALRFIVKEEGDDLGYEDDYPVENVKLTVGDYIFPRGMPAGQFSSVWEQLSAQGEESQAKLSLNFKTLESAVDYLLASFNMEPCEKTGKVETGVQGHSLLMSGTSVGSNMVLVKALVGHVPNQNIVACRITCRAKSQAVSGAIANLLSA